MASLFDHKAKHETYFSVKIGNTVLQNKYKQVVVDVTVDDSDEEGKLCRITVQDEGFRFLNNPYLTSEGLPVEVTMGFTNDFEVAFKGFITHVEQSFDEQYLPQLIIGATNTSDLMYKSYTREFKKIKRSDLVIKIAKEMGYKAVVQDTVEVVESIKQDKESNPKLLARLADDEGYVCSIVPASKTIYFHSRMKNFGNTPVELDYGFGNFMLKKVNAQVIYKNRSVVVEAAKAGADGTKKTASTASTTKAATTQAPKPVKLSVDGVTGQSRIKE